MKKKLTNNLLLKIISVAIAFTLWFVIINIDDPVDDKRFTNIKVNFINTNALTDQNKVYQVLDDTDKVTVKVEASRSLLENLSASDIVAEADFSKVTASDTVEIKFYSTRSNDEIRNITGSIDMVKLNIEDKKSKRLVLVTETVGEPKEGYIAGVPIMDQNRVEINGPESVISKITSAKLTVDLTDATSEISERPKIVLYDANGKAVDSEYVSMNTSSVKITVPILLTKQIPVVVETTGVPAEGYGATGEVKQTLSSVMVAGQESLLTSVTKVVIPETELDITDATESLVKTYSIKKFLPDGVSVVKSEESKITITVYVEKFREVVFKVPATQIHVVGIPEGYTVRFADEATEYILYLEGLKQNLDKVQVGSIAGYIQIDNLIESLDTELFEPGLYTAPIEFNIEGDVSQTRDVNALLSIQIIEEM